MSVYNEYSNPITKYLLTVPHSEMFLKSVQLKFKFFYMENVFNQRLKTFSM